MSRRQDLSQIHFVSTNTGDESLQDEANARIKELENIKQRIRNKAIIPSIEAHKVAIQDYVNKCKENLNNIITKIAKEQENAQGLFAKIQREITKNFQKTSEEYTSAINGLKEDNQKLQDDLKEIKEKVITENILKRADILLTHQEELNNQITERYSQLLAIAMSEYLKKVTSDAQNLTQPVVTSEEQDNGATPATTQTVVTSEEPTALAIPTPEANLMCPVVTSEEQDNGATPATTQPVVTSEAQDNGWGIFFGTILSVIMLVAYNRNKKVDTTSPLNLNLKKDDDNHENRGTGDDDDNNGRGNGWSLSDLFNKFYKSISETLKSRIVVGGESDMLLLRALSYSSEERVSDIQRYNTWLQDILWHYYTSSEERVSDIPNIESRDVETSREVEERMLNPQSLKQAANQQEVEGQQEAAHNTRSLELIQEEKHNPQSLEQEEERNTQSLEKDKIEKEVQHEVRSILDEIGDTGYIVPRLTMYSSLVTQHIRSMTRIKSAINDAQKKNNETLVKDNEQDLYAIKNILKSTLQSLAIKKFYSSSEVHEYMLLQMDAILHRYTDQKALLQKYNNNPILLSAILEVNRGDQHVLEDMLKEIRIFQERGRLIDPRIKETIYAIKGHIFITNSPNYDNKGDTPESVQQIYNDMFPELEKRINTLDTQHSNLKKQQQPLQSDLRQLQVDALNMSSNYDVMSILYKYLFIRGVNDRDLHHHDKFLRSSIGTFTEASKMREDIKEKAKQKDTLKAQIEHMFLSTICNNDGNYCAQRFANYRKEISALDEFPILKKLLQKEINNLDGKIKNQRPDENRESFALQIEPIFKFIKTLRGGYHHPKPQFINDNKSLQLNNIGDNALELIRALDTPPQNTDEFAERLIKLDELSRDSSEWYVKSVLDGLILEVKQDIFDWNDKCKQLQTRKLDRLDLQTKVSRLESEVNVNRLSKSKVKKIHEINELKAQILNIQEELNNSPQKEDSHIDTIKSAWDIPLSTILQLIVDKLLNEQDQELKSALKTLIIDMSIDPFLSEKEWIQDIDFLDRNENVRELQSYIIELKASLNDKSEDKEFVYLSSNKDILNCRKVIIKLKAKLHIQDIKKFQESYIPPYKETNHRYTLMEETPFHNPKLAEAQVLKQEEKESFREKMQKFIDLCQRYVTAAKSSNSEKVDEIGKEISLQIDEYTTIWTKARNQEWTERADHYFGYIRIIQDLTQATLIPLKNPELRTLINRHVEHTITELTQGMQIIWEENFRENLSQIDELYRRGDDTLRSVEQELQLQEIQEIQQEQNIVQQQENIEEQNNDQGQELPEEIVQPQIEAVQQQIAQQQENIGEQNNDQVQELPEEIVQPQIEAVQQQIAQQQENIEEQNNDQGQELPEEIVQRIERIMQKLQQQWIDEIQKMQQKKMQSAQKQGISGIWEIHEEIRKQPQMEEQQQDNVQQQPQIEAVQQQIAQENIEEQNNDQVQELPEEIVQPQPQMEEQQQDNVQQQPQIEAVQQQIAQQQENIEEQNNDQGQELPEEIVQPQMEEQQQDNVQQQPQIEAVQQQIAQQQENVLNNDQGQELPEEIVQPQIEAQQQIVQPQPQIEAQQQDNVLNNDQVQELPEEIVQPQIEAVQQQIAQQQENIEEQNNDQGQELPEEIVQPQQQIEAVQQQITQQQENIEAVQQQIQGTQNMVQQMHMRHIEQIQERQKLMQERQELLEQTQKIKNMAMQMQHIEVIQQTMQEIEELQKQMQETQPQIEAVQQQIQGTQNMVQQMQMRHIEQMHMRHIEQIQERQKLMQERQKLMQETQKIKNMAMQMQHIEVIQQTMQKIEELQKQMQETQEQDTQEQDTQEQIQQMHMQRIEQIQERQKLMQERQELVQNIQELIKQAHMRYIDVGQQMEEPQEIQKQMQEPQEIQKQMQETPEEKLKLMIHQTQPSQVDQQSAFPLESTVMHDNIHEQNNDIHEQNNNMQNDEDVSQIHPTTSLNPFEID